MKQTNADQVQFLKKPQRQTKRLKWHNTGESLYVYDDQGNSVKIGKDGSGTINVISAYNDGEELDPRDCDFDLLSHPLCSFDFQDLEDFIVNYRDYVCYYF